MLNPTFPGRWPHPAPLALARRLSAAADSVNVRAVSLCAGDIKSTFSLDGFTAAAGPLLKGLWRVASGGVPPADQRQPRTRVPRAPRRAMMSLAIIGATGEAPT